jgi:hypothetical protein
VRLRLRCEWLVPLAGEASLQDHGCFGAGQRGVHVWAYTHKARLRAGWEGHFIDAGGSPGRGLETVARIGVTLVVWRQGSATGGPCPRGWLR